MAQKDAVDAAIAALEDVRRHEENLNKKIKDLESKLHDLRVESETHIEKLQLELEDERKKRKAAEDELKSIPERRASRAVNVEEPSASLRNGNQSKIPSPRARQLPKNTKRLRPTVEDAVDDEPLLKRPKHKDAEYLLDPLQPVKTKAPANTKAPNATKASSDLNAAIKDIFGLRAGKAQHKHTDLIKVSTLSIAKITTIADTWKDIKDAAVDKGREPRFRSWMASNTANCAYSSVVIGKETKWNGAPYVACQLCRKAKQPCFKKSAVANRVVVLPGGGDSKKGQDFNYF
ncbi:hypothetical protein HII31_13303 [Pseudocercospora fuligena]|uniref:Uncharacterized protein n=1 Tax=Pseudocercospora fuligena TaxID=685502 RepID=A0A8H6VEL2_9PEZI|nr:hypothetical protein HII31_13303 [Pseudocercospora fuligena]